MREANRQFFDRYSVPHFALGAVFQASRIPAPVAIGSHVVFELGENKIKESVKRIWPDSRPDEWQNQLGDVVSFAAGYYVSQYLVNTKAGPMALSSMVGFAAALWTASVYQGHSWKE